jgi:hypothetical protein
MFDPCFVVDLDATLSRYLTDHLVLLSRLSFQRPAVRDSPLPLQKSQWRATQKKLIQNGGLLLKD